MGVPIIAVNSAGDRVSTLESDAVALVSRAEARSRRERKSKPQAVEDELCTVLQRAGIEVQPIRLHEAVQQLETLRQTGKGTEVRIVAKDIALPNGRPLPRRRDDVAEDIQFFEVERVHPDATAAELYDRLIGIDEQKSKLLSELRFLLNPKFLQTWSTKHYRRVIPLVEAQRHRVPLIILSGDVGTGKTALAETIAEPMIRDGLASRVHLLKINTQVRGKGHVGEMTHLIATAFEEATQRALAHPSEPTLLLIDEADALAVSRDTEQMHHEDRAGTNTLLQRLDNLRLQKAGLVVIFITNRPEALDPAIRRRASMELQFNRPNDEQRKLIFRRLLEGISISEKELSDLVAITGPINGRHYGFTSSDIVEKLLRQALRACAERDVTLTHPILRDIAIKVPPTPPFGAAR